MFLLGGIKLLLHLATAAHYPLHRDELYYLACGRHPAWAYPDHPGLTPWLASLTESLFGPSPFWLRLWPALGGAALVLLAGWMARRLGGGRLAQGLAALALVLSPLFLLANSLFQTVTLDQLAWTAGAAVLVAVFSGSDRRFLLLFGVVCALGVLAKLTILTWGFGVLVGLLATRQRALLRTPWIWAGALFAVAAAVPILVWQIDHGWPALEFMAGSRADAGVAPWVFLAQLLAMTGPLVGVALAGCGFLFLFGRESGGRWRALGVAVAVTWLVFLCTGGKPYYAGPTLPLLFAAGAVWLERRLARRFSPRLKRLTIALLVSQVWMLPFFLPVLPPAQLAAIIDVLPHDDWENQFGWEEAVAQTAELYAALPAADRAGLRFLTDNYGLAAALDVYGPGYGLPAALSGHNGYAFWETAPALDPLIVFDEDGGWLRRYYAEVRPLGVIHGADPIAGAEAGNEILYCRGLLQPAATFWAELRHFD